jgi:hypothetical protein
MAHGIGGRVELHSIHCFLVHASKHVADQPPIKGTAVLRGGRLFHMLAHIFDHAEADSPTDIGFDADALGQPRNACRDLLLAYVRDPHLDAGRAVALRLQQVTNPRSGTGLLFLMLGRAADASNGAPGGHVRLVLSRFPADQGVLAQESSESLAVEFLEKVFLRSTTAYKAAVYAGPGDLAAVWTGKAIDKQINHPGDQIARYWIRDFLASSLRTTAAAGTRRLALALRAAAHDLRDGQAKAQIMAAVTLAGGAAGQAVTAQEFCARFGLSGPAAAAVQAAMKDERLMHERFQFDAAEFHRHIAFRSIELSNGGILTAEAARFDEVFKQERLALVDADDVVITTRGRVVDQRLRRAKA